VRRVSSTVFVITALTFVLATNSSAQQTTDTPNIAMSSRADSTSQVPQLIRFSGTIKDVSGKPITGVAGVTFALYKDEA
jgi:hypothetical protein